MGIYGARYAIASTSGTVSLYIAIGICGKPVRNRSPSDRYKFGNEVLRELTYVIDSGVMSRSGGTRVGQFEYEFAEIYGAKCGIASASSTSSLHIAIGMLHPSCDEIDLKSRAYSSFKWLPSLLKSSVNCTFMTKFRNCLVHRSGFANPDRAGAGNAQSREVQC